MYLCTYLGNHGLNWSSLVLCLENRNIIIIIINDRFFGLVQLVIIIILNDGF